MNEPRYKVRWMLKRSLLMKDSEPIAYLGQALALAESLKASSRRVFILAEHPDGVPENVDKYFLHLICKVWLILCVWLAGTIMVMAAPITEADAVRAIIGEAANQPYEGQVALAAALRNRGTLHGVYGFSAKVLPKHTAKDRARALRAWQESAHRDPSLGATHWENVKAFGQPYWANSMRRTVLIGDHQFYTGTKKP